MTWTAQSVAAPIIYPTSALVDLAWPRLDRFFGRGRMGDFGHSLLLYHWESARFPDARLALGC